MKTVVQKAAKPALVPENTVIKRGFTELSEEELLVQPKVRENPRNCTEFFFFFAY